jgi:F-type H+-transporting ATPase subunit epsilon
VSSTLARAGRLHEPSMARAPAGAPLRSTRRAWDERTRLAAFALVDRSRYGNHQVDVVSAEEQIFSGEAKFVALPGETGELGILPGHTPLITRIRPGAVRIEVEGSNDEFVFVAGGILEVQPGAVTVLADTAIRGKDLDAAKAEDARKRAEKRCRTRSRTSTSQRRNRSSRPRWRSSKRSSVWRRSAAGTEPRARIPRKKALRAAFSSGGFVAVVPAASYRPIVLFHPRAAIRCQSVVSGARHHPLVGRPSRVRRSGAPNARRADQTKNGRRHRWQQTLACGR